MDAQFQYVEGQSRPGFPSLLTQYQRLSDLAAKAPGVELDVAYGPHARQRFDVFPASSQAQAVMLYLHAGYWQSRDKSLFRFLAPSFQARGMHVFMVNYPLCPDVSLAALVQAVRQCLPAIRRHALPGATADLPLILAGHSAGAHLAVELGLSDGGASVGPASLVDGICAISGIYDLEPLVSTSLNQRLQLDLESARALSPVHRVTAGAAPALWLVGADETPSFAEQSASMHQAWLSAGNWSRCVAQAGADHFTVLQDWMALRGASGQAFEPWWRAVNDFHRRKK